MVWLLSLSKDQVYTGAKFGDTCVQGLKPGCEGFSPLVWPNACRVRCDSSNAQRWMFRNIEGKGRGDSYHFNIPFLPEERDTSCYQKHSISHHLKGIPQGLFYWEVRWERRGRWISGMGVLKVAGKPGGGKNYERERVRKILWYILLQEMLVITSF